MDLIEQLQETRERTLGFFDLPDDALDRSPAPGKWSVRFILHHLADAETVLYDRIRRVISEPRGVIWAFDQDAWANSLDYAHLPMLLSRRIYLSVREGVIHQARLHYEQDGHLEYVHSTTGVRTLGQEFEKVVAHNEGHLEQIEAAIAGLRTH